MKKILFVFMFSILVMLVSCSNNTSNFSENDIDYEYVLCNDWDKECKLGLVEYKKNAYGEWDCTIITNSIFTVEPHKKVIFGIKGTPSSDISIGCLYYSKNGEFGYGSGWTQVGTFTRVGTEKIVIRMPWRGNNNPESYMEQISLKQSTTFEKQFEVQEKYLLRLDNYKTEPCSFDKLAF